MLPQTRTPLRFCECYYLCLQRAAGRGGEHRHLSILCYRCCTAYGIARRLFFFPLHCLLRYLERYLGARAYTWHETLPDMCVAACGFTAVLVFAFVCLYPVFCICVFLRIYVIGQSTGRARVSRNGAGAATCFTEPGSRCRRRQWARSFARRRTIFLLPRLRAVSPRSTRGGSDGRNSTVAVHRTCILRNTKTCEGPEFKPQLRLDSTNGVLLSSNFCGVKAVSTCKSWQK